MGNASFIYTEKTKRKNLREYPRVIVLDWDQSEEGLLYPRKG
jgi:hemerythrin superfamily protein